MPEQDHTKLIADFVRRWGDVEIKSTGAMLVNYSGALYNVDGSSPDPQIDGQNWKELLQAYGIDAPCYVTNETPPGNTHPEFGVGGHMTPNADGRVEIGSESYLMPLCHWHNHKNRDGVAFEHHETLMLRLTGFLQSEIAATFLARLPSAESHTLVYLANETWKTAKLTQDQAEAAASGTLSDDLLQCRLHEYVLLERIEHDDEPNYLIKKSTLAQQ